MYLYSINYIIFHFYSGKENDAKTAQESVDVEWQDFEIILYRQTDFNNQLILFQVG